MNCKMSIQSSAKRIAAWILAFAMLAAILPECAQGVKAEDVPADACGENLLWEFDLVTGMLRITGSGPMTDWNMPDDIPWYSFRDDIASVSLPDGLTSIGACAFWECSRLTEVSLPEGVKSIGGDAFYHCDNLSAVTIPDSTVSLGEWAFSHCYSLKSIRLPNGLDTVSDYAFYCCDSLKEVQIPASLRRIGSMAFAYCSSLDTFVIPDGTTYIGAYSFGFSALSSITIPDSVTYIGRGPFSGCSYLTEIRVGSKNTSYTDVDGVLFNKGKTTLIQYPGKKTGACRVPDGVTSIGEGAFFGCSSLTSVTIPDSVKAIGEKAFDECFSMTNAYLGGGVTSIGDNAFHDCESLVSVTIPRSVTSIGWYVFYPCRALENVYYTGSASEWEAVSVETGKESLTGKVRYNSSGPETVDSTDLHMVTFRADGGINVPAPQAKTQGKALSLSTKIPRKSYTVSFDANGGSPSVSSRSVECGFTGWNTSANGSGTIYRPGDAYTDDAGTTLYAQWIDSTIGSLPTPTRRGYTFNGWYTAAEGGSPVTGSTRVAGDMTVYAHWADAVLTGSCGDSLSWSFDEDTGVLTITGSGAMADWNNGNPPWQKCGSMIRAVSLPQGLTSIGNYAFTDCVNLTEITIPEGVTAIGSYAFYSLTRLKKAQIPSSVTSLGSCAFAECSALEELSALTNVTVLEYAAFAACASLKSISVPSAVTLGDYAFEGTMIDRFEIPRSMTEFNAMAFFDTPLKELTVAPGHPNFKTVDGVLFDADGKTLLLYPTGRPDESYTVPAGTVRIGDQAFLRAYYLKHIEMDGVQELGSSAFQQCNGLEEITIPDSVISADYFTFYGCTGLQRVHFGSGLAESSYQMFENCSRLREIDFGGLEAIYARTFARTGLTELELPAQITRVGIGAFGECKSLARVHLHGLQEIPSQMFLNDTALKELVLDEGTESIYRESFYNCPLLLEATIPASCTFVHSKAFSETTQLHCLGENMVRFGYNGYRPLDEIRVTGTREYENAFRVLELVNESRAENGLPPLRMDADLMDAAMLRAAEAMVLFSHTRPDSSIAFTACNKMNGENIAAGQSSPETAMNSWMNSQGHRENILRDGFQTIGVGCFNVGGIRCWVQCFGVNDAAQDCARPQDATVSQTILICPESFPDASNEGSIIQIGPTEYYTLVLEASAEASRLAPGETTAIHAWIRNPTFSVRCPIDADCLTWSSDDPAVASVSAGVVSTYKQGDCEITAETAHGLFRAQTPLQVQDLCADGHAWDGGRVTKEPTETQTGVRTYTCTRCGQTRTEEIPVKPHVHNYVDRVIEPACTEQGYTIHTCSGCGDSYTDSYIEALGHAWDGGRVTKEPTETQTGVRTYTCTRCGQTRTEEIPVKPHVHNYVDRVIEPACTEQGYTIHTCSGCGDSYTDSYIEALGHAWDGGRVTKEPTETQTGVRTYTCTRCGHSRTEVIPVTTHVHSYTEQVIAPTCTDQGYTIHTCSGCDSTYRDSYVSPLGHSFGRWAESKAAACTAEGEETRTCTRCGQTQIQPIPAIGHEYISTVTAPTCTQPGFTTFTCTRCGSSYTDDRKPALGHDYQDGFCTRCQAKEPDDAPDIDREALNRAIEEAERLDRSRYTDETAAALKNAIENAKAARTAITQAEIDAAKAALEAAVNALQEKPAFRFDDVKDPGMFYYEPVYWAFNAKPQITNGTDAAHFSPNTTCTRAQIVTFLWRANGCPEPTGTKNPFTDVKPQAYYYKAVLWAVEKGITNGVSATAFGPDRGCTRGQVVTFQWRAGGQQEPKAADNPFTDVKSDAYYYKAVLWAVENGITNGTSPDRFSPDKTCTRGQIVTFLYRDMK